MHLAQDNDVVHTLSPDRSDQPFGKAILPGRVWRVVMQEGPPSLAGRPPSFDHVLGDARLCDFKPELEQFAVDARRAPKRIFDAHPPNQYAQLRVDLRSTSLWARLPTPVAAKAGSMPMHERLGPYDCENLQD